MVRHVLSQLKEFNGVNTIIPTSDSRLKEGQKMGIATTTTTTATAKRRSGRLLFQKKVKDLKMKPSWVETNRNRNNYRTIDLNPDSVERREEVLKIFFLQKLGLVPRQNITIQQPYVPLKRVRIQEEEDSNESFIDDTDSSPESSQPKNSPELEEKETENENGPWTSGSRVVLKDLSIVCCPLRMNVGSENRGVVTANPTANPQNLPPSSPPPLLPPKVHKDLLTPLQSRWKNQAIFGQGQPESVQGGTSSSSLPRFRLRITRSDSNSWRLSSSPLYSTQTLSW